MENNAHIINQQVDFIISEAKLTSWTTVEVVENSNIKCNRSTKNPAPNPPKPSRVANFSITDPKMTEITQTGAWKEQNLEENGCCSHQKSYLSSAEAKPLEFQSPSRVGISRHNLANRPACPMQVSLNPSIRWTLEIKKQFNWQLGF